MRKALEQKRCVFACMCGSAHFSSGLATGKPAKPRISRTRDFFPTTTRNSPLTSSEHQTIQPRFSYDSICPLGPLTISVRQSQSPGSLRLPLLSLFCPGFFCPLSL
ncbi:hypothetical protein M441DRAFT_290872 [Trichoderma asperellum CBS 433.97]|uniref:Uncharacterized protein n=1 Tax=Trichoderma asperellum (strain ATCC 204424 / CBS 433.97 / NBRC 101777) TaxID=1042311 RepID=A0A2T3YTX7_TRIA4|nr:hypothetical protein M441DRAFT_290872 [Trichoderma asperellum CBS 433.97]PTB36032.1 hypothetical protein M441DRAFT_290872 [Trichoderma asperellum CBS 433.97]